MADPDLRSFDWRCAEYCGGVCKLPADPREDQPAPSAFRFGHYHGSAPAESGGHPVRGNFLFLPGFLCKHEPLYYGSGTECGYGGSLHAFSCLCVYSCPDFDFKEDAAGRGRPGAFHGFPCYQPHGDECESDCFKHLFPGGGAGRSSRRICGNPHGALPWDLPTR